MFVKVISESARKQFRSIDMSRSNEFEPKSINLKKIYIKSTEAEASDVEKCGKHDGNTKYTNMRDSFCFFFLFSVYLSNSKCHKPERNVIQTKTR